MSVRNIVGQIPEPEDLIGRGDLINYVHRQLAGNNILLLGPRRFGKSGVMRHLLRRPPEEFTLISLDLMDAASPAVFGERLLEAVLQQNKLRGWLNTAKSLPAKIRKTLTDTVDTIAYKDLKVELKGQAGTSWEKMVKGLIVELESAGMPLLLLLDEFPVMLSNLAERHGKAAAQKFMGWFSTLRMEGRETLRRHRYVIAGSIGVDVLLRRIDPPDKLRDFQRVAVGAIAEDDALTLARGLAEGLDIRMTDDLHREALDLLGPRIPFFIQLLYSQIAQAPQAVRHSLTSDRLRAIYTDRMLGPTQRHHFEHYRQRLRRYGKPRERAALAILKEVAFSPDGRVGASALYDVYRASRGRGANENEFDELMADLECECYLGLDPTTNEYFFFVKVMRDWWRRWCGTGRRQAAAGTAV